MTNIPSGAKRSWEGSEVVSHKRPRERDDARDWRDVHLRSPRHKTHTGGRESVDRRDVGERRSRHGSEYRGSRDHDHRRSSDYRDRDRRDDREKVRDRDQHLRRDGGRKENHRRRSPPSSRDDRGNGSVNGHSIVNGDVHRHRDDSEKEEGE